jgi:Icc-related predicted phosphoesterase
VVLAGDHLDIGGRADLVAQVVVLTALFAKMAESTTLIANSGNHDLTARREHGEKAATWMDDLDARVVVDGADVRVGTDLVSVCTWWEGPVTKGEMIDQLAAAATRRPADGTWIWVYHSPPQTSPTSWSGRRNFGDDLLDELVERYAPDLVLTGHVHEAPFKDGGSWYDRRGATLVLNAGRHTGPVPAHLVVDTGSGTIEWWTAFGQGEITL